MPIVSRVRAQPQDYYHLYDFKNFKSNFPGKSQEKRTSTKLHLNSSCQIKNEVLYTASNAGSASAIGTVLNQKTTQPVFRNNLSEPNVFFASSTACLKHPIPQSSKISCLLRTKPTDEVNTDNDITSLYSDPTKTIYMDKSANQSTYVSSSLKQKASNLKKEILSSRAGLIPDYFQTQENFEFDHKMRYHEYNREPQVQNSLVLFQSDSILGSSTRKVLAEKETIEFSQMKPSCYKLTRKVRLNATQSCQGSNKIQSNRQEGFSFRNRDIDNVWKNFVLGVRTDDENISHE